MSTSFAWPAGQNYPEHIGRGGFISGLSHHFQRDEPAQQAAGHPEIDALGAESPATGHVPPAGRRRREGRRRRNRRRRRRRRFGRLYRQQWQWQQQRRQSVQQTRPQDIPPRLFRADASQSRFDWQPRIGSVVVILLAARRQLQQPSICHAAARRQIQEKQ